jgi:hypothetical protein
LVIGRYILGGWLRAGEAAHWELPAGNMASTYPYMYIKTAKSFHHHPGSDFTFAFSCGGYLIQALDFIIICSITQLERKTNMTELLGSLHSIASHCCFLTPSFKTWCEPLSTDLKLWSCRCYGHHPDIALACANLSPEVAVACNTAGAWGLFKVFVTAVIANQATFLISPKGLS